MSLKPKVALSNEFLLQLAKLPAKVHTKVMKWAIQFQSDPKSPGINYENINGARDPNLKSVRLDGDWRGIVFKPSAGDVYVLLYVDHHDDAYRWAENRKVPQIAFTPDFEKYPAKQAPYKRNDTMLEVLPVGVLVFGGGGIQGNLADKARKLGIPTMQFDGGA